MTEYLVGGAKLACYCLNKWFLFSIVLPNSTMKILIFWQQKTCKILCFTSFWHILACTIPVIVTATVAHFVSSMVVWMWIVFCWWAQAFAWCSLQNRPAFDPYSGWNVGHGSCCQQCSTWTACIQALHLQLWQGLTAWCVCPFDSMLNGPQASASSCCISSWCTTSHKS